MKPVAKLQSFQTILMQNCWKISSVYFLLDYKTFRLNTDTAQRLTKTQRWKMFQSVKEEPESETCLKMFKWFKLEFVWEYNLPLTLLAYAPHTVYISCTIAYLSTTQWSGHITPVSILQIRLHPKVSAPASFTLPLGFRSKNCGRDSEVPVFGGTRSRMSDSSPPPPSPPPSL